jgi:hypothetical protein
MCATTASPWHGVLCDVRFGWVSIGCSRAEPPPLSPSLSLVSRQVLPLPGVRQTLVVADTNGLHCRGRAPPGTVRVALRPMGGENDGGVRRSNPFAQ